MKISVYNISINMRIGIFYHQKKVSREEVSLFAQKFEMRGAEVEIFSSEEEIEGVDRLVVLGGDGSILRAANKASRIGIPIVGVNYGTIGFLAEFERDEMEQLVDLALKKDGKILRRSMLEIEAGGNVYTCLNELSLMRRISPEAGESVIRILAKIDDNPAGEFSADGLIVATPTGSTGYSLAAGGSIFTPDCEVFLLTPVCAISLKSRPIVCSDKSELTFSFPKKSSVILCADGRFLMEIGGGECVTVRKSKKSADFLTKKRNDLFRRLTEKIN